MINRKNVISIHLLIFLISLIFQNFSIIDFSGFSLKLFHIIGLTFLVYFKDINFKLPPLYINLIYIFGLFVSLIMSFFYGLNSLVFNYIFGYYILVIFISFTEVLDKDDIYLLFTRFIIISFIIISINILFQYDKVFSFLTSHYGGHPSINTLISGGVNIEASWLAILAAFFYRKKYLNYIFAIWSLIISVLYGSRSASIANLLILIAIMIYIVKNKKIKEVIFLSALIIALIVIGINNGYVSILINRFLNVGDDNGSLGRINMWSMVIPALRNNIVGYGCGNAIIALRNFTALINAEDNVHNLYLQFLLDFGIVGFTFISIIVIRHLVSTFKNCNSFKLVILSYFILCLFEFRGGDTLFFVVLGAYYFLNRKELLNYAENPIRTERNFS